jgi:hypothetical protein
MRFELMAGGAMPDDPDKMYPSDQALFATLMPLKRRLEQKAIWG